MSICERQRAGDQRCGQRQDRIPRDPSASKHTTMGAREHGDNARSRHCRSRATLPSVWCLPCYRPPDVVEDLLAPVEDMVEGNHGESPAKILAVSNSALCSDAQAISFDDLRLNTHRPRLSCHRTNTTGLHRTQTRAGHPAPPSPKPMSRQVRSTPLGRPQRQRF